MAYELLAHDQNKVTKEENAIKMETTACVILLQRMVAVKSLLVVGLFTSFLLLRIFSDIMLNANGCFS